MASLSGYVGAIRMDSPVMLAAGILGTTGASLRRAALSGAGAVVTKSVGVAEREGHRGPVVVQVEGGLLNAMGLPNPSYRSFQEEIDIGREGGVPVIASIFGATTSEFGEVATGLDADGFELNLSCPHAERFGAEVGCEACNVEEITRAVKRSVSVPVWVKLTPNVAEITALGLAAQRGGADGVVAINTLKAMAIDVESCRPILGNRFGGLSGPAIKAVAVKSVYDLAGALDIPVIGVGGISRWEDAAEMIMAGACGVQVGTALRKPEGYGIFRSISEGLAIYLDRKGMTLEELVGAARRFS
ncbi:dihydroorotate dehydrogenase [Methanotrichaceae archaeon M04Ac]|uniref:Dihydroorotate dehydrogenase n=1 Tax=Candidatus Methanocrinis alkalitolerans TaxID=3033395 RepID=A0ABT5XE55_9EURY|nr:dihydroorotate dehydrogenase [Candidatus Methanocrinis alkalitolerans]MCR3883468.1 dihydroorotate dehydrogenase [Methanothrix sp.]MDF0592995.1 dihydroorotate dehydrogenase [Candidatus Methanocrinis alkalitolerans]